MVRLRFDTDLATSLKASQDLAKATERVAGAYTKTAKEANALERAAKRLVDANLTPQERYNQKLETMAKAVRAGKLNMDDAERTAGRLRQRLDDAGRSGVRAFGAGAVSQLASYAQGFIGLTALIGGVSQAFRTIQSDAEAAANAVYNSLGSFGQLQQVATSPQDFSRLIGQARGLQTAGVFGPQQGAQAADLVFALRNAGYTGGEIDFIARLGRTRQVKPEDLQKVAEGLKKYQDIFGRREAGGIQAVAQKVFQAAGETQSDFAQIALASTLFGSEAASLGITDEEALAAFVAIEKASPGPEEAATRLRSFLNQVKKHGIFKGDIGRTLDYVTTQVEGGKTAFDVLGESRAVAGFEILRSRRSDFAEQLRGISGAPAADVIGTRRFLGRDPRLRAALIRAEAEGALGQADEAKYAEQQELMTALRAETRRYFTERGDTVGRLFAGFTLGVADLFGGDRTALEQATASGIPSRELSAAIHDYLKRIAESNERIERGSGAPRPSGRQE